MVIDCGCPRSMVGKDWLNKYIAKHDLEMEDLEKTKCSQKFKFGPSQIYPSYAKVKLPIAVKELGNDNLIKRNIEVFILEADTIPLFAQPTMNAS